MKLCPKCKKPFIKKTKFWIEKKGHWVINWDHEIMVKETPLGKQTEVTKYCMRVKK